MRAIPDEAMRIVAKWEGFKPLAYLCPAGVPTIGFGHTKTVSRADVARGRKITRAARRSAATPGSRRGAREALPRIGAGHD